MWEFSHLFQADNKALKIFKKEVLEEGIRILDSFSIDPKSTEFSDLINDIFAYCEGLTFYPEDIYGMTLDKFRDSM